MLTMLVKEEKRQGTIYNLEEKNYNSYYVLCGDKSLIFAY